MKTARWGIYRQRKLRTTEFPIDCANVAIFKTEAEADAVLKLLKRSLTGTRRAGNIKVTFYKDEVS